MGQNAITLTQFGSVQTYAWYEEQLLDALTTARNSASKRTKMTLQDALVDYRIHGWEREAIEKQPLPFFGVKAQVIAEYAPLTDAQALYISGTSEAIHQGLKCGCPVGKKAAKLYAKDGYAAAILCDKTNHEPAQKEHFLPLVLRFEREDFIGREGVELRAHLVGLIVKQTRRYIYMAARYAAAYGLTITLRIQHNALVRSIRGQQVDEEDLAYGRRNPFANPWEEEADLRKRTCPCCKHVNDFKLYRFGSKKAQRCKGCGSYSSGLPGGPIRAQAWGGRNYGSSEHDKGGARIATVSSAIAYGDDCENLNREQLDALVFDLAPGFTLHDPVLEGAA